MNPTEAETLVRRMLEEHLEIFHEYPSSARVIDDLGADSLDVVEIVMSLEEESGISIPDAAIDDKEDLTVRDLVDLIAARQDA